MKNIYKITNILDNKIYIGQTKHNINKRFNQHKNDSKKIKLQNRPLYKAINEYGIENFKIELIEVCSNDIAYEREKFWIEFYNSFKNGYNSTMGGSGKMFFNHKEIAKELKNNPHGYLVAQKFNCCRDSVYHIAKEYNIKLKNNGVDNLSNANPPKKVEQYNLHTKEYIQTFNSVQEAAEWLLANNYINKIASGVRAHISEVARGKRQYAYGFIWKYPNN